MVSRKKEIISEITRRKKELISKVIRRRKELISKMVWACPFGVGLSAASPRHGARTQGFSSGLSASIPHAKGCTVFIAFQQCINAMNQMLRYLSMTRSEKVHDKVNEYNMIFEASREG